MHKIILIILISVASNLGLSQLGDSNHTGENDTLKTQLCACQSLKKGDSLILINGSKVCIQNIKQAGSKAKAGILESDCNIQVGPNIYPLQGGTGIKFNAKTGAIISGTLRLNTNVTTPIGNFELMNNSLVRFSGPYFTSGNLLKNAILEINGEKVEVIPNRTVSSDIRFDGNGKFSEATFLHEKEHFAIIKLTFPPLSRLVFKNGKLKKAFCPINSTFVLNKQNYTAKGSASPAAYEFDRDNNLVSITSGPNNSININGQDILIKDGLKVSFERIMNTYRIIEFHVAEDVTIKLNKDGKSIKVPYKSGRRVKLDEQNR